MMFMLGARAPGASTIPVQCCSWHRVCESIGGVRVAEICVFTGSAAGVRDSYAAGVTEFARRAVAADHGLVYGGGKVGLMGVVADAALAAGGTVIGVMPRALVDGEIGHTGLTRLEVVADMHERKQRMEELADAFVALPGGSGTLEELFEVWTWQQLGLHVKPVALLDIDGFWQPLLGMLRHMAAEGFLAQRFLDGLILEADPAHLLARITAWRPQAPKWAPQAQAASL